jgi:hypothetical protein
VNDSKLKDELLLLLENGERLKLALMLELGKFDADPTTKKDAQRNAAPEFRAGYEEWYSLAIEVVKHFLPDRFTNFTVLYRDDQKKAENHLTYGIADYMRGLKTSLQASLGSENTALLLFQQQLDILKSAQAVPQFRDLLRSRS